MAFVAFMEGKQLLNVARDLLSRESSPEELLEELESQADYSELEGVLYDFSADLHKKMQANQDNPSKISIIEKISEALDTYISKIGYETLIDVQTLKFRIEKYKQYLSQL